MNTNTLPLHGAWASAKATALRLSVGLMLIASVSWVTAHAATAQKVAAGDNHTLAILSDGTLWAWGDNSSGQLGNGSTAVSASPVNIGAGFVQVASAGNHSFGVRSDGSVWAWGDNSRGQLGTGTSAPVANPTQVGTGFTQIASSVSHTLALKADGTLWAWGSNLWGQLGRDDGFNVYDYVSGPVQVGAGFTQVSAANGFSAAVKADGSLWVWGFVGYLANNPIPVGETGPPCRDIQLRPCQFGTGYSRVWAGGQFLVALGMDGVLRGWGKRTTPGFGWTSGFGFEQYDLVAGSSQVATDVVQVAAGERHYLTVQRDGSLITQGAKVPGVAYSDSVVRVQVGTGFAQVATGKSHSVGIKVDGSVWLWGDNSLGQLGNGSINTTAVATYASSWVLGTNFKAVDVGEDHAVALTATGDLLTWGQNYHGQLGNGSVLDANAPVALGTGFASVGSGGSTAYAIKADGELWAWGSNVSALVGNGVVWQSGKVETQRIKQPAQIGNGFSSVAAGFSHAAARKTDGSLWTWGYNGSGQLGNANTGVVSSPQFVATGFSQVTAVGADTFALETSGMVSTWGATAKFGAGNGVVAVPTQFDARRFASVTVVDRRVDALKADGTLWALFDPNAKVIADFNRPVQIGSGFVSSFNLYTATYLRYSLGLKADGTLWTWGDNSLGQMGDGLPSTGIDPVQIGSGFSKLVGDQRLALLDSNYDQNSWNRFVLALKTDGTLVGWGKHSVLQLGKPQVTLSQVQFPGATQPHPLNGQVTVTGPASNLTLTATLTPEPIDTQGSTQGTMFFVAILPDGRVFTNTLNGWLPLDAVKREGYGSGLRDTRVDLLIGVNTVDLKGTHIYLGYGLGSTATESWDEMLTSRRFKLGTTL